MCRFGASSDGGHQALPPLDRERDPMASESPAGARKSPSAAGLTCGSHALAGYKSPGRKQQPFPPTRVSPSLLTNLVGRGKASSPLHAAGRCPKGTQKDGGWGSGSPLTRAFAGTKPHTHSTSLPASACLTRHGWLAPIFGDGRQVSTSRRLDSPSPWLSHTCLVLSPLCEASPPHTCKYSALHIDPEK